MECEMINKKVTDELEELPNSFLQCSDQDLDYNPGEDQQPKYHKIIEDPNDDMPMKWRHVRNGERSVREEYHILVNKLKSEFHMSDRQIEGSIIAIANDLFGRKWKPYTPKTNFDDNTLPDMRNERSVEPYIEAFVLSSIVEEIMTCDENSVVTYSCDGSSLSKTGNFVVQSFIIDGKQRALPTFGITTESKNNLKDLQMTTLKLLTAACGHRYTEKDILEKIDFVMTDSTAHNLGVTEMVCKEYEIEKAPPSLVCHIHPLMKFQSIIKDIYQDIHNSLGASRIKDCFLVNVDFRSESFVYKAIRCLTSFINKDYSNHKWNRQSRFDQFIHPKKNETVSLKDHRFNRIFKCCDSLVHHIDDIKAFLEKFQNIVNEVSVMDVSFLDMELLKPILVATSLFGIHVCSPFAYMLMDPESTYNTLKSSFPILYRNLTEQNPKDLFTMEQVFSFTTSEHHKNSLPKKIIQDSIITCANAYQKEVYDLLTIMLSRVAEGFSDQRGAVFGFGPKAEEETGAILKISTASPSKRAKLEKAPVHNLAEERSVGFINYELNLRGREHLESVSKNMILCKGKDFIKCPPANMKLADFRKPAKEIKEIKLQWIKKLEKYREEGYKQQEVINLKNEATKLEILEFLKGQQVQGPFTNINEIKMFMESTEESQSKNNRMKKEVKYARLTCTSLKPTAPVFRLERKSKNLPTQEYAENLTSYLDKARCIKTLTLLDLKHVLTGLTAQVSKYNCNETSSNSQEFSIGEHIAAFWIEDKYDWHLGVVDLIKPNGNPQVSYLYSTDKERKIWTFPDPDNIEVQETGKEQIILKKIKVEYLSSINIKCEICDINAVKFLNEEIMKLNTEK